MEKAKLSVVKTKNNAIEVKIVFENGKSIPIQKFNQPDPLSYNNKEVEVVRESGAIVAIYLNGNEIYNRDKARATYNDRRHSKDQTYYNKLNHFNQKGQQQSISVIYSKSPYNFVPLNEKVVFTEPPPDFDRYHLDRYTGYIELSIEAKTPVYIRDTMTEDEEKRENFINSDFFSPGGRLRIPGSSLRGMIRTMVEIISFGKFGFFDDRRLYFRGLADKSSIRKEYQNIMSSFDSNSKKSVYKMSAGYIYRKGLHYYIKPATTFGQISKSNAEEYINDSIKEFTYYPYKDESVLVVSGHMNNKKREWIISKPSNGAADIELSSQDILDYKNDSNRNKKVPDLLNIKKGEKIPCFYILYSDNQGRQRVAFGHTAMFRIPYKKSISDHIPSNLLDREKTDISEAIFGKESEFASRVFFEDAFWVGDSKSALMGETTPKILSGPKPTTFQHYLEQKDINLQDFPKNLANYNSDTNIRGYKLYWHKDGNDWIETEKEIHKTQYTKINPVKAGTTFRARIRFENLSAVELGALLFALDLPDGCCHKLGMAKPLGLGSIRITPKLFLSDRKMRYEDLSAEWIDSIKEADRKNIDEFKFKFENYILKNIQSSEKSLWNEYRMKQLRVMLDWTKKPSNDKTGYLGLGEFRNRRVLPHPEKVI